MGVKSNLPEVRARRQAVFAGDEGRVKAQKDLGKLTARERLTALFDAASFVELNALNEDAGVVAGFGTIDGRGAYAFAQDFTVGLGAVGDAHAKKIAKVVELARDSGSPVIGIYDTAGAKLEEGAMALDAYARIGAALASASGVVPSIALVMGHCGGIAAACAQMQDFVILSKAGELFVNGPQVAGAKSLDDIAGGEAAMKGGACHIVAESDEAALGYARKLVSLLPDNNMEDALNETGDDVNRELPAYNEIETLEVARPFGRGFDQIGGFDFEESLAVEEAADLLRHLVPQDHVALQGRAAQVEVAVFHTQVVAAVRLLFDGEGRGLRLVEHLDPLGDHFDVARGHLGVLRLALDDASRDAEHPFAAHARSRFAHLRRRMLLDRDLRQPVAVAQVDEGHGAEVSHFLHPPGQGHGLVHVAGSQAAARMGSVHGIVFCIFVPIRYLCLRNSQS